MIFTEILLQASPTINWFEIGNLPTLLVKFAIDILVVYLIVKQIYSKKNDKREYIFTYFIFNILIFFLCHLMVNVELGMGFAFGLFALFSIMRYRTQTISIKDMTYLFAVVCTAVMNSINIAELAVLELLFINASIVSALYIMEQSFFQEQLVSRKVQYEKVKLVQPQHYDELKADLEERMGLNIKKIEVYSVNYLTDSAVLYIHFDANETQNSLETKIDLDEMDAAKFNGRAQLEETLA